MKLKTVHDTWCKSPLNTSKVWFFSYTHITLHQLHSHHCTLTCLSLTTHSWISDTADMSQITHTWTHTKAHHIQAQHCLTSAAHPQDDLWIPVVTRAHQYSKSIPHKPLTSSLLRCSWFSSVLFLLSWVSKPNTLDWAALSLETARSRACSTYIEKQLCYTDVHRRMFFPYPLPTKAL